MYLVPYIHTQTKCGDVVLHAIQVFLAEGGTSFWKTEESRLPPERIQKDYCEENGIFVKQIEILGDFAFCEVNSNNTNLNDFYKWTETKQECWRIFYSFTDESGKLIGQEFLQSIYLGVHSASFVCSEVLRLSS